MKKIISAALFLFCLMVSNSCKVNNPEPVYQVENGDERATLDYVNIERPVVYMESAYFIDLGETGKMEFLNDKEVLFTGEYTITSASKNARIKSGTLLDGSVAYIRTDGGSTEVTVKLFNGVEVGVGYKYDYYAADPATGIKDTKVAYKVSYELAINRGRESGVISLFSLNVSPDLTIGYYMEEVIEIIEGKRIWGAKKDIYKIQGGLSITVKGSLSSDGLKIPIIPSKKLPKIVLLGVPFTITPAVEFGIKISGKIDVTGTCKIIEGSYTATTLYNYENDQWVEKSSSAQKMLEYGQLKGGLSGEINIGPYFTLAAYLGRFELTDKLAVSGAKFAVDLFFYNKVKAEVSPNGECLGTITSNFGAEVGFGFAFGILEIEKDEEALLPVKTLIESLTFNGPSVAAVGLACIKGALPVTLDNLAQFRNHLKTNTSLKFPVHERGGSPPSLAGDYEFIPAFLEASSLGSNDPDLKTNVGSAVIRILNTVNTKGLDIWQYKDGERLPFDHQKIQNSRVNWDATGDLTWGSGNTFTLCAETAGDNDAYTNYVAISATVDASGDFKDVYYAYYRKSNKSENSTTFPTGFIRVFKDGDGISKRRQQ